MKREQGDIKDMEREAFEAELRRLRPGRLPEDLLERFAAVRGCQGSEFERELERSPAATSPAWLSMLGRWLAPALGAAAIVMAAAGWWAWEQARQAASSKAPPKTAAPVLNADSVEFDRQLVASFDAITSLPDGEPVRVRFSEWEDQIRFSDSARGVTVEKRTPRLEVVPVRFETY
jgi:hypothetical protein